MCGKSSAPKYTRKPKERCSCGRYYYNRLVGISMKLADACSVCKPIKQEEEKRR